MNKRTFIIVCLIISTFGPYLFKGLRLESLYLYSLFLYLLFTSPILKINLNKNLYLSLIWVSFILMFVGIMIPTIFEGGINLSNLSLIENYIMPIVLIFVLKILMNSSNDELTDDIVRKASYTLITLLSINTIFIIIDMFYMNLSILSYFHGDLSSGTVSVYEKAASMGRATGIFNQPIESGIMYSIGLFGLHFLRSDGIKRKTFYIFTVLIFFGGIVSVSKTFLFIGIPLFILFNAKNILFSVREFSLVIIIPLSIYVFYIVLQNWNGKEYLLRFFNGFNDNSLSLFTGGRFGNNALVQTYLVESLNDSWIIGEGIGALNIYDNAFILYILEGGIIGIISFFVIILLLILSAFRIVGNKYKIFYIQLIVLLIVSNLGAPVFSLNRVSLILLLFISLLMYKKKKKEKRLYYENRNSNILV